MRKSKPRTALGQQINQYDKILQENIESALPGLIKNVLHINAVTSEELPDSIQHTKERKPDLLKRITDDKGNVFVLHIEFQTKNDADIVYRMFEYLAMLLRMYKIPVKQYVIYIGEDKMNMVDTLTNEGSIFRYNLIDISAIDYHVFLRSGNTEEKMFAILANFGKENAEAVIKKIVDDIAQNSTGDLEWSRRKKQLRILAQLRNLAVSNIEIMESVASFYKIENDIVYRVGRKEGIENGKTIFIKGLLEQTDFTTEKIAEIGDVPVSFVETVKASLAKSSRK
jgi:predicted transposase/invertase (TIGR01784 family)